MVYDGNDIQAQKVASLEDCARLCGEEDLCQYWSFHHKWQLCDLKTSNHKNRSTAEYSSGQKPCGPMKVTLVGSCNASRQGILLTWEERDNNITLARKVVFVFTRNDSSSAYGIVGIAGIVEVK